MSTKEDIELLEKRIDSLWKDVEELKKDIKKQKVELDRFEKTKYSLEDFEEKVSLILSDIKKEKNELRIENAFLSLRLCLNLLFWFYDKYSIEERAFLIEGAISSRDELVRLTQEAL